MIIIAKTRSIQLYYVIYFKKKIKVVKRKWGKKTKNKTENMMILKMNKNQFINKEIIFINIIYIANEGRLKHKSCHAYPQD